MRTRVLILIAAVFAAIGIAVPAGQAATDNGIVVFEPPSQLSDTFVDLGDGGFSAGDIILENGGLTGGTGRYAGTRGTVSVVGAEVDGEEGVTITFHLTRR